MLPYGNWRTQLSITAAELQNVVPRRTRVSEYQSGNFSCSECKIEVILGLVSLTIPT